METNLCNVKWEKDFIFHFSEILLANMATNFLALWVWEGCIMEQFGMTHIQNDVFRCESSLFSDC